MREKLPKSENRKQNEISALERRKRRADVEKAVLQGVIDTAALSVRYGVSRAVIDKDIKWCFKQFALRDEKGRAVQKAHRVAELLNVIENAYIAFRRSQEAEETVTIKIEDGEEVETRTTKGQAGDPAFLRIAKDAIVERAKLDGLYVTKHEVASAANSPIPQEKVKELDERLMAITERLRARGNTIPSNN